MSSLRSVFLRVSLEDIHGMHCNKISLRSIIKYLACTNVIEYVLDRVCNRLVKMLLKMKLINIKIFVEIYKILIKW